MNVPTAQQTLIKDIGESRNGITPRILIESTHLMRVDGIEHMNCIKQSYGPISGYLEAVARALSVALSKRPEELVPEDLLRTKLWLSDIDRELHRSAANVMSRALAKFPNERKAAERFRIALRQRVAARLLSRLRPDFARAANRRIRQEAKKHYADVWL